MKTRVVLLVLSLVAFGCSPDDPHLPGYRTGSGNVTPFILKSAISYGARPIKTTALPQIEAKWRYKTDKDGVQIYLHGDYMVQVQTLLLAAFGSPAMSAKTNQDGRLTGLVYSAAVIGAAISCGRDDARDGTRYTQVVIVRQEALRP